MRRCLRRLWGDQRGVVLVMALMLMGLMGALAGMYAMMVKADVKMTGGAGRTRTGFYAAEAGLNVGMAETSNLIEAFTVPDEYEETIAIGSGSHQRLVNYSLTPDPTCNPCATQTIPAGQPFAGLNTIPYRYRVTSIAENAEGDEEAELGAEFEVHSIPIFQFLAFYADDLYLMPAEDMPLTGRVHTNGNLYLNVNSGAKLTIGDSPPTMPFVQVSAAENIYRGGKKDYTGQICTGTVTIDKLEDKVSPFSNFDPRDLTCVGSGSSPVPKTTLNAYKGSLLAGINPLKVPDMSSIARGGDDAEYWQRAELRIVLNLDPAARVPNFCETPLTTPGLFAIEVQDASGGRNTAKTTALWQFMCERRGAIFYNDIPNGATAGNPSDSLARGRTNYTPPFNGSDDPNNSNYRVYRRIGEDTNGDGIVDSNGDGTTSNHDRNDAICPIGTGSRPWWRPDFCDKLGTWPYNPLLSSAPLWFRDADYRRGGFYNRREEKWIYMLNVNVRALIDWNEFSGGLLFSPSDSSDGGLVFFFSVQGPNSNASANNYGVRIFDSADLNTRGSTFPWPASSDPTGLTVVSDQAIYIQGNYNYKDKYPAAVIGDALNVLSQGWEVPVSSGAVPNDRKSMSSSLTTRDVPNEDGFEYSGENCGNPPSDSKCRSFTSSTALGINAAFISGIGINPPGQGLYNGGLENFPRFHESWTDKQLNYRGSFVSLGEPNHQKNDWECGSGSPCNIYDPPDRPWNYDTDFNDVRNLPPLTPRVTYVQQRLYTRFYK